MPDALRIRFGLTVSVVAIVATLLACDAVRVARSDTGQPPGNSVTTGLRTITLEVQRNTREYMVYVPESYRTGDPWPVVVVFHGGGGNAESMLRTTGWDEEAEGERFLAVFPQGTAIDRPRRRSRRDGRFWNDGSGRESIPAARQNVDDIAFVNQLLADLEDRYSVDKRRVYATGFSNGAGMAFRVARELSTTFAAVAPVAGADWSPEAEPTRPVPVLYITGDADPLNPLEGGAVRVGRRTMGTKPDVGEMLDEWVRINKCERSRGITTKQRGVTGVEYLDETGKSGVILYTLKNHGHHWPGSESRLPARLVGPNTSTLDAAAIIWEFFEEHKLPAPR